MPLFNPGIIGPTGPQGPQGPAGPAGATGAIGPGASGIYILNAGATLGVFGSINFHGPGVTASATGIVADVYITGGGGGVATLPSSLSKLFLLMGG